MRESLEIGKLKSVYNTVSKRYDLQHAFFTLNSDSRGRKMVIEHSISEGDKVLDAGAGTGSTALLAAEKAGPKGSVTLFDLSEGMLEEARVKAEAAGLSERVEFMTGDMMALPFEDGEFDVVVSTYSLCPLYDPAIGARELYRVTRPGGLLAAAHSTNPDNPLIRSIADLVESIAWKIPGLSLGCRPINILDALRAVGAEIEFETTIGVPLWPFKVFVARKPL